MASKTSSEPEIFIHPALDILPLTCNSWKIYPEDIYPGGGYLDTDFGKVRYWLFGPETGIKIVLIHGLSLPSLIWKHIAPSLASHGFRVLVYDLYGHGYTQAPEITYTTELYTTELYLLLKHVKWEKANLMGASMGGGIAVSFIDKYSEMVDENIVLLASSGLLPVPRDFRSIPTPERTRPYIPDSNLSILDDISQEIIRLQSTHLPGHNYAVASSIQNGPLHNLAPAFRSEHFRGKSIILFHGTLDMIVPYRLATEMLLLFNPTIIKRKQLYTIPGGPHGLALARPEIIDVILEGVQGWFRKENWIDQQKYFDDEAGPGRDEPRLWP
ncbi:alpha/beta-hydrolase [Dendrothele bispora CBS 962.96]|uniref:Alpha/beta-hydrolase n=1 Tax=Dendrothele bispora (strain CBS 962.96) TaxID=1314807 RepID=A0A4S8L0P8_DENBC|nr:alpha/beta-hydrolase [Dendrothele bispora CBS 962.96]